MTRGDKSILYLVLEPHANRPLTTRTEQDLRSCKLYYKSEPDQTSRLELMSAVSGRIRRISFKITGINDEYLNIVRAADVIKPKTHRLTPVDAAINLSVLRLFEDLT